GRVHERARACRRLDGEVSADVSVAVGAPGAVALVDVRMCRVPLCGMDVSAAPGARVIDTYLGYLRDVRRMSPNTIESYARDLAALAAFAERRGSTVDTLGRRDLEAFARQLMTDGLAPRSVARAVACVRGFYKFL